MKAGKACLFIVLFFYNLAVARDHSPCKILVTGGAGFIGSHVVEALLARGDKVVIVDNMNNYYDKRIKRSNLESIRTRFAKSAVLFYKCDICDREQLEQIFKKEQPEIICHLAARAGVRPSVQNPRLYCKTNILGTLNLLELARKFSIKNFVLASSSSVYGESDSLPFKEYQVTDKPVSPYAVTKRSCELLAYTYHVLYKIPCSCLRFFTVYGPRGRPDMAPFKFLDAVLQGKEIILYGDGAAIRDFTYIDDVVDGVVKAIDNPFGFEIFNIGRGQPIPIKEFIKIIEETTGRKAVIREVSAIPGDVLMTHADITKARKKLGYSPSTSVRKGMEYFYTWYLQEYLPIIAKSRKA